MKPTATLLAIAALAASLFTASARAETSPVRLTVKQESKSDNNGFTKVQSRTLKITLLNTGDESLPLRVKYAFFGRNTGSRDTVIVDHSDITTQLQPKSDQTLTTKTQTAKLIEEHFEKKKKVEASGQKFTGWGVKVWQDGNVIAEACDPPSMLDDLAKMPGLPAPKAKPAPAPAPAKPAAKPAPKPAPSTPAPVAK